MFGEVGVVYIGMGLVGVEMGLMGMFVNGA